MKGEFLQYKAGHQTPVNNTFRWKGVSGYMDLNY